MKQTNLHAPIGIFDSGVGGLTVANALVKRLPQEHILYFGDTAHMPYGDKSTAAIQAYVLKVVNVLLQANCKLILIACNSASAAAYDLVKEYVDGKALVVNVIDPVVAYLCKQLPHQHIGLIGTRQTVNSQVYQRKIAASHADIHLTAYATNLLAPAIEEFGNHDVIDGLLQVYLNHPGFASIDALLLACTHYPLIKDRIAHFYNDQMQIIDASVIVADAVANCLAQHQLLAQHQPAEKTFYVSDYTEMFAANAKLFFGDAITLKPHPLWTT